MKFVKYLIALLVFVVGCKVSSPNMLESRTSLLNGQWKVIGASFTPFEHISFCRKLEIGSIFHFENNGDLKVYNKREDKNCNSEQHFELDSNFILLQEGDMLFKYEIETLTLDTLIFKIRSIPSYIFEDSIELVINSEVGVRDPNFYIILKKDGIDVILTRNKDR